MAKTFDEVVYALLKKEIKTHSGGTDEFVKMDSTTDAHYLEDLIDKQTIINDNGTLKVKKLDDQEVTITEINYLKGLTMNVMDLVNAFANGGVKVLSTPLNTASELTTMDRSTFIDGISYIVYVLADENHAGAKTTYLVDKTNTTFFGNADSQRNFTTNPINLANEVTGKLETSKLTIDNTYKTSTLTNNIFGTSGAKAMYDELNNTKLDKLQGSDKSGNLMTIGDDGVIHADTPFIESFSASSVFLKGDKTNGALQGGSLYVIGGQIALLTGYFYVLPSITAGWNNLSKISTSWKYKPKVGYNSKAAASGYNSTDNKRIFTHVQVDTTTIIGYFTKEDTSITVNTGLHFSMWFPVQRR